MSNAKIKAGDLPLTVWAFIRRIWNGGEGYRVCMIGGVAVLETLLQHVEFHPLERGRYRLKVWGKHMDRSANGPAIDRVLEAVE